MKIYQPRFFLLFAISAVLTLTFSMCYKAGKREMERRRNMESLAQQAHIILLTKTLFSKNHAAMLITTNLVHRPCTCGFCRLSEGIVVPEHVNAIGFDTFVEVSTNYLPIVEHPGYQQ